MKRADLALDDAYTAANRTLGSDSVVILPKNYSDLLYHEHQRLTRYPQYRNSRTGGSRSTRTQIDHDVFEGLPVRHWRKRPINISTAPGKENMNDMKARNLPWPELEMPRDYHLLSEMSQNLLRAARMPQAKKSIIAPLMEDDKEPGEDEDADGEIDTGFVAKRWAVVPKDQEGPEPEFLAKRRKGLPSIHGSAVAALGTAQRMRKTKIRKVEVSGESSVLEVLVTEGQTVDGEIFEEETSPTQAPAPGTVVEGVGVVNAEGVVIARDQNAPTNNRRRPPPPKRKAKGPGRGRKKKVAFAGADGKPTSRETNDMADGIRRAEDDPGIEGGLEASDHGGATIDESLLQEGEELSDEGSEGEEGEEGDREEGELSPSLSPPTSPSKNSPMFTAELRGEHQNTSPAEVNPPLESARTIKAAIDPLLGSLPDEDVGSSAHENSGTPHQGSGEIQRNKTPPEPIRASQNALDVEPSTQPDSGTPLQDVMNIASDTAAHDDDGMPAELSPKDELITSHPVEDVAVEVTENPTGELSAATATQPLPDSLPGLELGEMKGSYAETGPQTSHETVVIAGDEPPTAQIPDPGSSVTLDSALQSNSASQAEPIPETQEEPTLDDVSRIKTESSPRNQDELAVEPTSDGSLKAEKQVEPLVNEEALPAPATRITEEPLAMSVEKPQFEMPLESTVSRPSDFHYEAPIESAERRFSFTRPTGSPKAPTPSPPTPIEDKFALRAPYVSPKAPTMSPPTPLDRSMPSSPDVPLSEQQFALPPPIDVVEEGSLAPVPTMHRISDSARISVEAAPQAEPHFNAQIPIEHDPLDGMAEPRLADNSAPDTTSNEQPVLFPDGEEDLLGSLERSLDQRDRA